MKINKLSLKVKALNEKVRHRNKKIKNMKGLLKYLKEQQLIADEQHLILKHNFGGMAKELFENQLKNSSSPVMGKNIVLKQNNLH